MRSETEIKNLEHVLNMFRDVLIPLDSSRVDEYIAPGYIQHSQLAPPGRDALKEFLDTVRGENPNGTQTILRSFVDDDHVIIHYHVCRWPDDPGFMVIDIFRLEDGMIVEHWDVLQDVVTDGPNSISQF